MPALSTSWSGTRAAPVQSVSRTQSTVRTASTPRRTCHCQGSARSSFLNQVQEGSKCSAYPPLVLEPPALYDSAWIHSFKAWVDAAIQQPVELCSSSGGPAGEAWSSQVHVLGTAHHNPSNPRAIQEAAAAIQPDAIMCEQPDGMKNLIRKAADSPQLLALLDRVLDTPITSLRQAHCELLSTEERVKWELGLRSQKIRLSSDGVSHYVWRKLEYAELLAAVRVARKRGATLAMMDLDEGARAALEAARDSVVSQSNQRAASLDSASASVAPAAAAEDSSAGPQGADSALVRDLAAVLAPFQDPALDACTLQWLTDVKSASAGYPPALVEAFLLKSSMEALAPDKMLAYQQLNPMPAEVQAASGDRERAMAQRIRELCSGSLTGKPRRRVLVITGKAHALPLRTLLSAQAQG